MASRLSQPGVCCGGAAGGARDEEGQSEFSKQHFRAYKYPYAAGQRAQQIEVDLDAHKYMADGHALEDSITDDEREQADPSAQIEIEKTEKLTNIIALNQEINLFNNILTTANITQNLTPSGTSKWSDYVNSDPVSVVLAARRDDSRVFIGSGRAEGRRVRADDSYPRVLLAQPIACERQGFFGVSVKVIRITPLLGKLTERRHQIRTTNLMGGARHLLGRNPGSPPPSGYRKVRGVQDSAEVRTLSGPRERRASPSRRSSRYGRAA